MLRAYRLIKIGRVLYTYDATLVSLIPFASFSTKFWKIPSLKPRPNFRAKVTKSKFIIEDGSLKSILGGGRFDAGVCFQMKTLREAPAGEACNQMVISITRAPSKALFENFPRVPDIIAKNFSRSTRDNKKLRNFARNFPGRESSSESGKFFLFGDFYASAWMTARTEKDHEI